MEKIQGFFEQENIKDQEFKFKDFTEFESFDCVWEGCKFEVCDLAMVSHGNKFVNCEFKTCKFKGGEFDGTLFEKCKFISCPITASFNLMTKAEFVNCRHNETWLSR